MAVSRATPCSVFNAAQLRFVSNTIAMFVPIRMLYLWNRRYKVGPTAELRIDPNRLLAPERETLAKTRAKLGLTGQHFNPTHPTHEFFESLLPDPTVRDTNEIDSEIWLSNLPEESGVYDVDGTFTLSGEWIEALHDPKMEDSRPRCNTVLLYFHGGGHAFCSAAFHRQLVTRMVLELGPGARAFVVDYRLAPENPFPAAVHDAFAAYLYLTNPGHDAFRHVNFKGAKNQQHLVSPVNPKDIVLAGDSAGAGVVIAFQLYMRDYVQPSVEPKFELPSVTVLISFSFSTNFLCGDAKLAPNERNSGGKALEWEWYRHLAQHPLVSPVHTALLSGLGSHTLLQAGAFDRLADDTRFYGYKLGQADDSKLTRLELYRDMVHVHQFFEFLPMAEQAVKSMARFIERAQTIPLPTTAAPAPSKLSGLEWIMIDVDGAEREGHVDDDGSIAALELHWRQGPKKHM
ncbi:hypothetical protein BGW38_010066 [Lunasporangiospora selenospora]|uniref:Alpha/beta hydrolase fold-3 domain-containing protein n=1 Tax=Lunasporangiospora selenospora TaxID=979761 RepID=A0A9P6FXG2_9FUNG|nr:hypothetical protein BGW38_010066 [Lunasporangiospora selenospora]